MSTEAGPSTGEEAPSRGRGGFRREASVSNTAPTNVSMFHAPPDAKGKSIDVMANFVRVTPMKEQLIYQYRVDYDPSIDAVSLRTRMFRRASEAIFNRNYTYDGVSDVRSSVKTSEEVISAEIQHPMEPETKVKITIKRVGTVNWSGMEMIRLYNMNMKSFLRAMGFFQASTTGAYVHQEMREVIGQHNIVMVRGFRTACNVHEQKQILLNLEAVHKLIQTRNIRDHMRQVQQEAQRNRSSVVDSIKHALQGKLCITSYGDRKRIFRIEDVSFDVTPKSTFKDHKRDKDISYLEYYKSRYEVEIKDPSQPMLLAKENRAKRYDGTGDEDGSVYLVPELCNIAGLTEDQRNDNRVKMDLIRSSQINPMDRVKHARAFLKRLADNSFVAQKLSSWGYSFDTDLIKLRGRILPAESIGLGQRAQQNPGTWPKVDEKTGSFDRLVVNERLAKIPEINKFAILISRNDLNNEQRLIETLKRAFEKIGLVPRAPKVFQMKEGDNAHIYCNYLRNLPDDTTAALVIMTNQNKEKYDAIKKESSIKKGLITQVVTSRLLMDERKANSAAVKIGIQLAAKVGGEPWHVSIPLGGVMACGYDTYHDTSNRGRSFGAFVASTNDSLSRWFSKADSHDKLDELSSNLVDNMAAALKNYKRLNKDYPRRVVLYRDGVSDGQIDHVFRVELAAVKKVVEDLNTGIMLTMIIVNKRVGARFFMRTSTGFENPSPGSVIDNVVTREGRYDFYLISQSTRNGTINPTYYNIIYDQSGFTPDKHQMLAFKMCFLYYNWSGTVRVPAPCQYAHKLAYLCGEHLHGIPNANLDDRLHFL